MFPVTELKNVLFPLPANALKIAVKIKEIDSPTIPKILMHLCPWPLGINSLFSIIFQTIAYQISNFIFYLHMLLLFEQFFLNEIIFSYEIASLNICELKLDDM